MVNVLLRCFRKHVKVAGCSIATLTTASEVCGLCYYLFYYVDYIRTETAQEANVDQEHVEQERQAESSGKPRA